MSQRQRWFHTNSPARLERSAQWQGQAPILVASLTALAMLGPSPSKAAAPDCAGLLDASIRNAAITSAAVLPAGSTLGTVTVTRPVCRVVGVVSTQPGEKIGIEVWLPTSSWNGRFEGIGSGGFGGFIDTASLATNSARGFAAANTDTGHVAPNYGVPGQPLPWAENPVSLADWGHTSIHLMTVAAKAITETYYGQPARYAYYDGCSTGGGEGIEEAEFFPDDYDGIRSGSPGNDYSHLMMSFIWNGILPTNNPAAVLPAATLTLLSNAVLGSCGGAQAVSDGFLEDPRQCRFDPSRLLCRAGQDPGRCLSAAQVGEAAQLYSPVRGPFGSELYPGFVRGSESQWALIQGTLATYFAQPLFANTVFGSPNWDFTTFNFGSDARLVNRKLSPVINATRPDLSRFRARGGRLIMTAGWADAFNAQTRPIEYFNSVAITNSSLEETMSFFRLFMAPGMSHCGGGPGPNTIGGAAPPVSYSPERDVISALAGWVEQQAAPDHFISTKYNNDMPAQGVKLERRLCPYPAVGRYKGTGDAAAASSYECVTDEALFAKDVEHELLRMISDSLPEGVNLP